MQEYERLKARVDLLQYHQKLLLELVDNPKLPFYRLVIESGITETEITNFYTLCDKLSKKMAEQKAEGYVNFHPLFEKLLFSMPASLDASKVVKACLDQDLYRPLFIEFAKYI
ncbi:YhaI family protein [Neobacillus niacini]|uniref:YhaI family protein n=1 Tax=Neobacillus niacini TaxID=86668 RepID=UPI0021CB6DA9|nr:YhaI family protein [Neobacillus niacini]MCM3767365.1 YhaI family protein [Neobacillus niacini]